MKSRSRFATEIKLSRPFRSAAHEASIAIIRTASRLRIGLDRIARQEGISLAQFNILRILRGSDRPLPTMEISDRMVEIEPAVTRLLGKLEKSGLIKRQKNPSDARSVLCTITVDGLALLARLDAPMARFEDEHLGSLEEHRLQELISSLAQILTPTT